MRCERAGNLLQLYVDHRLDAHHISELDAHLAGCAHCRRDLDVLSMVCAAVSEPDPFAMPADLTVRIMGRIAENELMRAAVARARYRLSWADARLAAAFATTTTLLFILISPMLRLAVGDVLRGTFPQVISALLAPGPGSIAWLAWFVWIVAGVGLTLWLAGGEVRGMWRRSLSHRFPQIPQLRQLW